RRVHFSWITDRRVRLLRLASASGLPAYHRRMWTFEGHGLEFIPLDVRRKLDLAGLRPSLATWQALREQTRPALDPAPERGFREKVLAAIPDVERVEPRTDRPWVTEDARRAIEARAGISLKEWDELEDAQRYALHRLADPRKDIAKLRAALVE